MRKRPKTRIENLRERKPVRAVAGQAGRSFRILRAAFEKFLADNCTIRGSAIAYAIVISIIPMMTILVQFANVDRMALRTGLARFLAAYGMSETSELMAILDEILQRANLVTSIGAIFMIYSATNLLSNLEDSFNAIYRVRRNRPLLYRFALYIASFVVLPTLVIAFFSTARYLLNLVEPADFNHAVIAPDDARSFWVVGDDGRIRIFGAEGERREIDLSQRVDREAPFRDVYFDIKTGAVGPGYRIAGENEPARRVQTQDFFSLNRMAVTEDRIYVVSESGLFLYSEDLGQTWQHHVLMFKEDSATYPPAVRDMVALSDGSLLLLATLDSQSGLIYFWNDRWVLRPLGRIYNQILRVTNIPVDAGGPFRNGLYIVGKGRYLFSDNEGISWNGPVPIRYGPAYINIQALDGAPNGDLIFGGAQGALWREMRNSQERLNARALIDQHITAIDLDSEGQGVLVGRNGLFRYTLDAGRTWLRPSTDDLEDEDFLFALNLPDGSRILTGENETLVRINGATLSDRTESLGFAYVDVDHEVISDFPLMRWLLLRIAVGILGLAGLLGMFVLAYRFVPNAFVDWRAATVGGAISAVSLLAFIVGFRIYAASPTTTTFIYGVWAAIPLGLIVILTSTQIVLFGLEVAYVIQHPYLHRSRSGVAEETAEDSLLWNSLMLLSLTYHSMYQNKSALTDEVALDYFDRDSERLEFTRERLVRAGLVLYDPSGGEYLPARPAVEITVAEMQRLILENALRIPRHGLEMGSKFQERMQSMQKELLDRLGEASGQMNVAELLPLLKESKPVQAVDKRLRKKKNGVTGR